MVELVIMEVNLNSLVRRTESFADRLMKEAWQQRLAAVWIRGYVKNERIHSGAGEWTM